jgi:hypothetical protein
VDGKAPSSPAKAAGFRPFLEELGPRIAPAAADLYWNGSDGEGWSARSFYNPATQTLATPKNGDNLIFDGSVLTNSNDDMPGLYLSSLTVSINYTKTIDISQILQVGTTDGKTPTNTASSLYGGKLNIKANQQFAVFAGATFDFGGARWTAPAPPVSSWSMRAPP